MSRSTDKSKSFQYLPGIAVLAFVAVAATQGHKQVVASEEILKRGEQSGKYIFTAIDEPKRGTVYTSDGEIAAQNENSATVGIRFDRVPNSVGFFMAVSEATGISATELECLAADEKIRSREWRSRLSTEQIRNLEKVRTDWRADGLSIHRSGVREYPFGTAASSILGGTSEGGRRFGLESSFDSVLAGTPGKTVGMVDRDGSFLPMRLDRSSVRRVDGQHLTLTVDSELQICASQAIRTAVEANRASSGTAIILDPMTGDLLAMANWPSFDPDEPLNDADDSGMAAGMNPNYMLAWEPGSTFKILTLAKGLDMGVVRMDDKVSCAGTIQVWTGKKVGCAAHNGTRAHGTLDSTAAIARSCNVTASIWAKKIGHPEMTQYLEQLGLVSKTKLGLPGERAGSYYRKEHAKGLQLALFGFGQSLTVTPVGLAAAFGTLANGGIRMEPRIVKSVSETQYPIRASEQILKKGTCELLLECMTQVFESDRGTGRSLQISGYQLGGKTGTAQKINPETGTVEGGGYVSSFVGFVPAKQPKAVILVMVDDPKVQYYGAEVAGPVFVEIAKKTIERLHIPKSAEKETNHPVRSSAAPDIEAMKVLRTRSKPVVNVSAKRVGTPSISPVSNAHKNAASEPKPEKAGGP